MLKRYPIIVLLLALFCSQLPAQNKKNQKEETDKAQTTFKVPVNVIVVNVTVSDKNGNPVSDLTANDFKVFEEGKPQAIQTFAMESYEPAPAEAAKTQERPSAQTGMMPGSSRPRLISLVIDDITAKSNDRYARMIQAVTSFVKNDLGPMDQVTILSGSGRVRYPFSDDKQRLLEEIDEMFGKLNLAVAIQSDCPDLTDLQAQRISDRQAWGASMDAQDPSLQVAVAEAIRCLNLNTESDSEEDRKRIIEIAKNHVLMEASRHIQESEYLTHSLLDTLRKHLRSLRHFEATKSLVLFSDGFLAQSTSPVFFQLQEVVDLALRSGVVLNCVDIRGLDTYFPSASERNILDASIAGQKMSFYREDQLAQEDPLFQMSSETGGLFFHNNNDLYGGLQKIVHRQSAYYVLTYAMPSQKADGRYRRIKLEVSRPGLELSYRKGYYAPKEEMTFERRKKEDIMEALQAPGNLNEIPLHLAYNYYQEDDSTYGVSFLTNISIRGLHFLDEDARRKNLISMVLVAFDENDRYIDGVEKSIEFRLLETSYASLLDQGLTSRVELKLPMGRYKIKAVVRESTQGKIGSVTKAVEIP